LEIILKKELLLFSRPSISEEKLSYVSEVLRSEGIITGERD